jgi:hypothetical protein
MTDPVLNVPVAEVRPVAEFHFEAELIAVKNAMESRREQAVIIGRAFKRAKAAGRLREFAEAAGILAVTAEGYILQADIADGTLPVARRIVKRAPTYTLKEVRAMLADAENLQDAIAAVDDAIRQQS